MDLLSLAIVCGPWVAPATTLGVIGVESAGHPWAIHDNTDGVSYWPRSLSEAQVLAGDLIRARHSVDLGLMQINYDAWFKTTRVRLEVAFNPCLNISFGTIILSAAYARESRLPVSPAQALKQALSVYNSGDRNRAVAYADRVINAVHAAHPTLKPAAASEAH
jgi:type IV secretion system protein VirB1